MSLADASQRTDYLGILFDRLEIGQVLALLAARPADAPFEFVVTPNVDHMVTLLDEQGGADLRTAYRDAGLILCDSRILARLALLHGIHLPVVPGSDLSARLFAEVIRPGDRIAIVGGGAEELAILRAKFPGVEFNQHIPPMGLRGNPAALAEAAAFIRASRARFTFLAVGSPQQEMLAALIKQGGDAVGVGLCVGASIEFITGTSRRAPRVMQKMGLEWAHRLASEPKRLWRRYLVKGPKIFLLAARWKRSQRRQ